MTKSKITFFEWIKTQADRGDIVGDLATDMVRDAKLDNLDYQTVEEWKRRVWFKTQDPDIRAAFNQAHDEYNAL